MSPCTGEATRDAIETQLTEVVFHGNEVTDAEIYTAIAPQRQNGALSVGETTLQRAELFRREARG